MSWVIEGQRPPSSKKKYVECKGPGPHDTKTGSPWLVVGFHKFTGDEDKLEDGTYRCKKCREKRRIYLPSDTGKSVGYFIITEQEKEQIRTGLAELRKTFAVMEAKILDKINNDRTTKPTSRQGEL